MELRQLRYFAAVAEHRHFTRAAAELHVAQSALSQQVRRLEAELGFELLARTSRHVELTDAGRAVLARAHRVLAEVDALRGDLDELAGLVRGTVRVGGMPPLGPVSLPDLLADFHALHPNVEVVLREGAADEILALLRRDEVDVALAFVAPDAVGPELAAREIGRDELVVAAAPDDPIAAAGAVALADLDGRPFIGFYPGSAMSRAVEAALSEAGSRPRIAYQTYLLEMVRALAARGLGVSLVPRRFLELGGPPLAIRPIAPEPMFLPISLVWRAQRRRSPAAEAFLAFTLELAAARSAS